MNTNNQKLEKKVNLPIFRTFSSPENDKIKSHTFKKYKKPEKAEFHFLMKKNIKFVIRKGQYFQTEKHSHNKKRNSENPNFNDGRWTKDEKRKFLEGISLYGTNWRKVKSLILTRTAIQVRSHAQKFFNKMKKYKDEQLGIDFTKKNICSIKDMIKEVRSINSNYNLIDIFIHLSNKICKKRKFKRANKIYNIRNEAIINKKKFPVNLEDNSNNYNKNNNLNDLNKNSKINPLEATDKKSRLIQNSNMNFIPPNNTIQFNNINFINNNLSLNALDLNNTFLNSNNNYDSFQKALYYIKQLNNIYNDLLSNNYANYYNNINDEFLLSILLENNKIIPLFSALSTINILLRNINMNIAPMIDYQNKDNGLKELNNENDKKSP